MYLTTKYFQKSFHLLLPFTGIPKEGAFKPKNTYLYSLDINIEDINNCYLIVVYEKVEGPLYKIYEQNVIMKSNNLTSCYETEDYNIYIFNIIEWAEEVYFFLRGEYSKFSDKSKLKIIQWAGGSQLTKRKLEGFTVHIALFPEYYHDDIAKQLGYKDDSYLKQVWEMWSKPDVFKETFDEYIKENKQDCKLEKIEI